MSLDLPRRETDDASDLGVIKTVQPVREEYLARETWQRQQGAFNYREARCVLIASAGR